MASPVQARSALGNTIKNRPDDLEAIEAARIQLAEANAEADVRNWPPLSAETRARLACLLLTGGDHAP